MRISDWSSDVCSSDLGTMLVHARFEQIGDRRDRRRVAAHRHHVAVTKREREHRHRALRRSGAAAGGDEKLGRASCRKECVSTCRHRWSPYLYKKNRSKNQLYTTTTIT